MLLARSLLSEITADLAGLLREVAAWLLVPVAGVVSDGQHSIQIAVAEVFVPEVPHQLCQFHFLREAARPVHEAASACPERTWQTLSGGAPHRTEGRHTAGRPRAGSAGGLLRGGARGTHRPGQPASAFRPGGEAAAPAARDRRLPFPNREKRGLFPPALGGLKSRLEGALQETAALFAPREIAYRYLWRIGSILENRPGSSGRRVRRRLLGTLAMMSRWGVARNPELRPWVAQFRKVLANYGGGLFPCYDVEQLPRTNNDLEQYFGSYRIIERRVTGHKVSSVRTVTRGSVRLLAGVSTRSVRFSPADLVPTSLANYYRLRAELTLRKRPRREQLRLRRKPLEFLQHLEEVASKATLPP